MTAKQVIGAINEVMRDMHTNCIRIQTSKHPISAYGPVIAIRKSGDSFPFQVRIQECDECFWVDMGTMPDWKEVLWELYKVIVPNWHIAAIESSKKVAVRKVRK